MLQPRFLSRFLTILFGEKKGPPLCCSSSSSSSSSFTAKKKTSDFPPVLRRELFFGKQKVSAGDEEGKGVVVVELRTKASRNRKAEAADEKGGLCCVPVGKGGEGTRRGKGETIRMDGRGRRKQP